MKDKNTTLKKKLYSTPLVTKIGSMIVHTNGTTSRTNDPGGNVGGKA